MKIHLKLLFAVAFAATQCNANTTNITLFKNAILHEALEIAEMQGEENAHEWLKRLVRNVNNAALGKIAKTLNSDIFYEFDEQGNALREYSKEELLAQARAIGVIIDAINKNIIHLTVEAGCRIT